MLKLLRFYSTVYPYHRLQQARPLPQNKLFNNFKVFLYFFCLLRYRNWFRQLLHRLMLSVIFVYIWKASPCGSQKVCNLELNLVLWSDIFQVNRQFQNQFYLSRRFRVRLPYYPFALIHVRPDNYIYVEY